MSDSADLDLLIVGAGISGISMGAHMQMMCPQMRFAMIERRERIGGTWDLFRYPGVRSDSDMHSLGFRFAPWTGDRAIADGEEIRAYLDRVVADYDLAPHLQCGTRVLSADWDGSCDLWQVRVKDPQGERTMTARFLYLASGYYDYDEPYQAHLPGIDQFAGDVVHPQFWPQGLTLEGRRIVVIGSGATAVSLVPALVERGAMVTMLQRTPTWMAAQPSVDRKALLLRRFLPGKLAYKAIRAINTRLHHLFFKRARSQPQKVAAYLLRKSREALGPAWEERHFRPPYDPWDQRLCLVPDADLFEAVKSGDARLVTDRVADFEKDAVLLESGERLPADIVVTATGLKLALGGGIAVSVDGAPVDWTQHWFYRGCMFSNLPNLAVVFGYLNASWALRADNSAAYVARVLKHMHRTGSTRATPVLPPGQALEEADIILYSSGYLQRARSLMPKSAAALPWRLNQDFFEDCRDFRRRPVADGVLQFERQVTSPAQIP